MAQLMTIGRYEIRSELGRGGMAVVYLAYDPRFERDVAIKVLPSEYLHDPDFRVRFEREAKTIAALEHPAVVPVYDFGEEDGRLFLVMRLMTGGSLAGRLQGMPLPAEEVSHILTRISAALDVAHEQGIIHRDLKPGNILFDQYGEAYLSDFGIARFSEAHATLTGSKAALGTPGYMSPEQIQGEKVDSRCDIYALGVILFEMLTGTRPFAAESPAMVLVRQMTESTPHISEVRPDLSPQYDDLVSRTMARERDERPDTAGEVASLLFAAALASFEAARELTEAAEQSSQMKRGETIFQPTVVDTPAEALAVTAVEDDSFSGGHEEEETAEEKRRPDNESSSGHEPSDEDSRSRRWIWLLIGAAVFAAIVLVLWSIREQGILPSSDISVGSVTPAVIQEDSENISTIPEESHREQPDLMALQETVSALLDEGDFEAVLSETNAILEENDQLPFAYLMRGIANREIGKIDEAKANFLRAIELNPEETTAHRELSRLYLAGQDFERAFGHINAVIEQDPLDSISYYQRGVILREMGDIQAAIEDFRHYMDMVPYEDCPECHEDAQQFLETESDDAERPPSESKLPKLGVATVPIEDLAREIPWLPLDSDIRPATMLIAFNLEQAPYENLFLRRALAMALDREHLARIAAENGFIEPKRATTVTHQDTMGRDLFNDVGIPYEPDVARALLAEAGFPDGANLPPVNLFVSSDPHSRVVMGAVADAWRDILGIEVEVISLEGDYYSIIESDRPGLYQAEWSVDINDPDNVLREAFHPGAPFNLSGFNRDDYDQLMEEAVMLAKDPVARQHIYIRGERILNEEETATIPLFHFYQRR